MGEQSHAKPNSTFKTLFGISRPLVSLDHHPFLLHFFFASCLSRDSSDAIHLF